MGFGVQTSKRIYHLPFPPVSYHFIEQNGTINLIERLWEIDIAYIWLFTQRLLSLYKTIQYK